MTDDNAALPIAALRASFLDVVDRKPVVVSSPTGSGKSTEIPRWCRAHAPDARVLVVEPRRVACRSLAARVADLEATLSFYERAFGFSRKFVEAPYGELSTGETTLAFTQRDFIEKLIPTTLAGAGLENPAPPMELGFVTTEVDRDWKRAVDAGAASVKAPADKPWGQRVGYVRDLNGFLIELCSPMG